MNRIAKLAAVVALPAALLLTACTGSNTGNNAKPTNTPAMAHGVNRTGKMVIASAVQFTCPESGKPERSFYLHDKTVAPAEVKFGTELVVGNASATPNSCTWGYELEVDKASQKALALYPEAFVESSESPGQMGFSSRNDSYEQERSSRNSVQLARGTTQWMVLETPSDKGIALKLGCPDNADHFGCVTNWPQALKGLHKITQP